MSAEQPVGDRIEIRGLRVLGTHGVLADEQHRAQPFEIDLDLELSLDEAARSDALDRTVDYGLVTERVRRLVAEAHFELLEALAGALADLALEAERVRAVTVTVRKLRPPIAADVSTVGVRLRRTRQGEGGRLGRS